MLHPRSKSSSLEPSFNHFNSYFFFPIHHQVQESTLLPNFHSHQLSATVYSAMAPRQWEVAVEGWILSGYLHDEFIAGVTTIHFRAGKPEFPGIEGSSMPQPITSLPQDLFIHSDALHPWNTRKQLSAGANKDVQGWTLSPRLPPSRQCICPTLEQG